MKRSNRKLVTGIALIIFFLPQDPDPQAASPPLTRRLPAECRDDVEAGGFIKYLVSYAEEEPLSTGL